MQTPLRVQYPPEKTGAVVEEIPLRPDVPGCDQHPEGGAFRLEVQWRGYEDKVYAKYDDFCSTCLVWIGNLENPRGSAGSA